MTFKTVNENCDKACYISRVLEISRQTPGARSGERCCAATGVFQKPFGMAKVLWNIKSFHARAQVSKLGSSAEL